MNAEHIYTDCDFVKRLVFLCSQKGIKYKSIENLPRVLAMEFVNSGIVSLTAGAKETKEGLIENTRQKISRDIKNGSPLKVEFLDWYCRFFNCSADYLMGYIDTPTHEEKSMKELTGLAPGATKILVDKYPIVIDALNDLLTDIGPFTTEDSFYIGRKKMALLEDLHRYLTEQKEVQGLFSELVDKYDMDDYIYVKGDRLALATFKPEKLPLIKMLSIQEDLQDIKRFYQRREEEKKQPPAI